MKEIAIVCFLWGKHTPILLEYLAHLPDTYGRTVVIPRCYSKPQVTLPIEALGAKTLMLESVLTPFEYREANKNQIKALAKLRNAFTAPTWKTFCDSIGAPAADTAETICKNLASQLPGMAVFTKALEKIAQNYFVELIILSEDVMNLARTFIVWGRKERIPSLHIQHGPVIALPFSVHKDLFADYMAVYGKQAANAFAHIPEEKIFITGNDSWKIYSEYARIKSDIRAKVVAKYKIDPALPIVLFGTTWAAKLSAHADQNKHEKALTAMLLAYKQLQRQVTFIIKDRPSNAALEKYQCLTKTRSEQCGLQASDYIYTTTDMEILLTAADVLVSCDSSLSIEAMHAETPAINLVTEWGLLLGGAFHAENGILDVCGYNAQQLADNIEALLQNQVLRAQQIEKMKRYVSLYNITAHRGNATANVATLMQKLARKPPKEAPIAAIKKSYLWETLDDLDDNPIMDFYHTSPRFELIDMFESEPKRYLEIGCAAGATIKEVKKAYPRCQTIGVELNKQAAQIAKQHADIIIGKPLEDVKLEDYGIQKGSIDTVILADVLEHMYNPWRALKTIHPYLTDHAQVLASIPNVKNLWLISQILGNHWTYEKEGLLDITHVRFFTFPEIIKLFSETGYTVTKKNRTRDARVHIEPPKDKILDLGKIVIRDVSAEEFEDLKTLQFLTLANPIKDHDRKIPGETAETNDQSY